MTGQSNPYARVYYSVIDDVRFRGIYDDDACFAAWVRLLMLADATWPASPPIPSGCRPAALRKLIAAGLVDVMPGHRYRIHGLDRERSGRADAAARAANKRWHNDNGCVSNADALTKSMLAEPSQAEPSQAEPSQAEDGSIELEETTVRGKQSRARGLTPIRDILG